MIIHFYGGAQDHTGSLDSIEISGSPDIRALIDSLGERFGSDFKQILLGSETFFFLVNGKGTMQTGGFATKLSPGDKIEILPFIDAG